MDLVHTDKAIAKKLLAGDETAFRDMFDRFFPRLYRYALARLGGNADEANEVVQLTFSKAFEHLGTYRGEASLYSWMCRICRNAIIDFARRRQRGGESLGLESAVDGVEHAVDTAEAPPNSEPENATARRDMIRLIQETLDRLPAHYGDVLEWKYIEELSVDEIASKLGIGSKAAESMLTRARRAFREVIVSVNESSDVLPYDIAAIVES